MPLSAARSRASRSPMVSSWRPARSPRRARHRSASAAFSAANEGACGSGVMKVRWVVLHQPFDFAFIVALARPAEAVAKQKMANQLAEGARADALAVAQDARHRQRRIMGWTPP